MEQAGFRVGGLVTAQTLMSLAVGLRDLGIVRELPDLSPPLDPDSSWAYIPSLERNPTLVLELLERLDLAYFHVCVATFGCREFLYRMQGEDTVLRALIGPNGERLLPIWQIQDLSRDHPDGEEMREALEALREEQYRWHVPPLILVPA